MLFLIFGVNLSLYHLNMLILMHFFDLNAFQNISVFNFFGSLRGGLQLSHWPKFFWNSMEIHFNGFYCTYLALRKKVFIERE